MVVATARAESAGEGPPEPSEQAAQPLATETSGSDTLALLESRPETRRRRQFSDGPRLVPRARGAALARAQALGIGGHFTTKRLLWNRPDGELQKAVPGPAPRSLLWPVVGGHWGRGFGFTRKVRTELRHNGIDIGAPLGTPVRAAADGLVIFSDNNLDGLGNAVMILHAGGFTTLYGHNLRTTVQPGWFVKRGERIALVGATGMAWGPHVHFELRDNGRWRDPKPFLLGYRDESLNGPLVELRKPEAVQPATPRLKKSAARAAEPQRKRSAPGTAKAGPRARHRVS